MPKYNVRQDSHPGVRQPEYWSPPALKEAYDAGELVEVMPGHLIRKRFYRYRDGQLRVNHGPDV